MKQKPSVLKIITLINCVLLILSAGVLTLIGGTQALGLNSGRPGGDFARGEINGDFAPPSGDGSSTRPYEGDMQPPSGDENWSGQQGQTPGDFQGRTGMGNRFSTQSKLLIVARYAVGVLVILFGVLAAVGTWLSRKWGKAMAVITALIVLAYAIPTMLRMMGGASLYFNIANIVLSVALVVFSFFKGKNLMLEEEQVIS